ncbi:MAG TPA: aminopeptidase N [Acidimicrobiales bacterium]|nr:aminopeptidase N [Acidimicrobiales bacterium]
MADNLTRSEAEHRASYLSRAAYEVHLDLTAGEDTFVSDTTIRFAANLTGQPTFVDLDAVEVRRVTLNDRVLDPAAYDAGRARFPVRGLLPTNVLRVVAECSYRHAGVGLHRFVDPVDGHVYLHTQFEPFNAHQVFACFDQPDLKGAFTLTVTAPEGWTVVSNGPVAERVEGRWRFQPTPPISPYLAAVVAGPYHAVSDAHGPIALGLYCRRSLAPHLDADELFELTRQGLDFFTAEFDYPYPFAKYDQLFVPEFNFGAMENPGCVTFNEGAVFRSRVTEAARESRAGTLLHEMAHMWFGDLVTMRWWDDLWLNESFATYMASHALASCTRFADAWVRFAAGTKAAAAHQDQLPSTHPISADIVDTDAVRLHFDGITYAKGASVLKQLVAWVGADAFREGVRTYFWRYEWANARLAEFLAALEETSGRDLGSWSKEWLETAGINTLRARVLEEDGRYGSVVVEQSGQPGFDTLRSHRLAVGAYRLGPEGLVRDQRVELDVVGAETVVDGLAGVAVADLLLLNDDDLTYAKIRLDERSLATALAHLGTLRDPMARNLVWASAWDMARDAELAASRFLELVTVHAPGEPDDSALQRLLFQALHAADAFSDPAHRPAARARLAAVGREGLAAAEPGSDRQLIWARLVVSAGDGPEAAAFARGLLEGAGVPPGLEVDTDLRWHVVAALAAAGEDGDGALVAAELERDPTDIGERRAAAALASRPTAAAKEEAWARLHDPAQPLALLRSVAGSFFQHGQDDLVRPYVGPYLEALPRWWEERTPDEALRLAGGLFPDTVVEPATVDAASAALDAGGLPGPMRRVVLEGRDRVERALRARAADAAG